MFAGNDLDDIASAQAVVERYHLAVHFCADTVVSNIRVNAVCEVDGYRTSGQFNHVALGSEHKNLVREQIDFEGFHELLGIAKILLPFKYLAKPSQLLREVVLDPARSGLLIYPVRGNTV